MKRKETDFCDGCCQRTNCNHDLEKCCYLRNQRCLIRETRKYGEDKGKWDF